ncbi:MAG: arginine--tRNA ligase [Cenarchaeum symbiont of Oopsacas minuta]|nr:arginine--tRNA ligase [Cenarchaeum symbiont of Oopsacas minuta]
MSFELLLDEIASNVKIILDENNIGDAKFQISLAKPGFGDASCNVSFLLTGRLKKSPYEIAKDLAESYTKKFTDGLVHHVSAHTSGYLNFKADWEKLGTLVLQNSTKPEYGSGLPCGKITIEHTSVNPNKALHIGHVRNIVVGDTISRILEKFGYNVCILNYVDDSGLQIAELLYGFMHLGMSLDPPENKKFDHYCGDDVYVRVNQEIDKDPNVALECAHILKMMEDPNTDEAKMACKITRRVLDAQLETCWALQARYNCINFESHIMHSGMWDESFTKLKDMKLVEFEDKGDNLGCWVVRGEKNDADKVLVRKNGTATYMAKDIPYAAWKLGLVKDPFGYSKYPTLCGETMWQTNLNGEKISKDFASEKVITVIDSRQARLQKIVARLMDKFKSNDGAYVHLGYESVTLSTQTAESLGTKIKSGRVQMSGRKGVYVNADTVLKSLRDRTVQETIKRNPDMSRDDVERTSKDIAVATIRYEMIRQDLDKIITFDASRSLSLEGDTASYIQYTHARALRILERYDKTLDVSAKHTIRWGMHEQELLRQIGIFATFVRDASENLSPKTMARYCHRLAMTFNSFYENVRVLDSDNPIDVNSRVCLVFSFSCVLRTALGLLGITAPKRM